MSKNPFAAPRPTYGEFEYKYLERLADAFEEWANATARPAEEVQQELDLPLRIVFTDSLRNLEGGPQ